MYAYLLLSQTSLSSDNTVSSLQVLQICFKPVNWQQNDGNDRFCLASQELFHAHKDTLCTLSRLEKCLFGYRQERKEEERLKVVPDNISFALGCIYSSYLFIYKVWHI